uniref:Uncharacterized protein n=1 Tax=Anguilla anguilla TaxID=7936 RepID=A0A0E9TT31_ANGAN
MHMTLDGQRQTQHLVPALYHPLQALLNVQDVRLGLLIQDLPGLVGLRFGRAFNRLAPLHQGVMKKCLLRRS